MLIMNYSDIILRCCVQYGGNSVLKKKQTGGGHGSRKKLVNDAANAGRDRHAAAV